MPRRRAPLGPGGGFPPGYTPGGPPSGDPRQAPPAGPGGGFPPGYTPGGGPPGGGFPPGYTPGGDPRQPPPAGPGGSPPSGYAPGGGPPVYIPGGNPRQPPAYIPGGDRPPTPPPAGRAAPTPQAWGEAGARMPVEWGEGRAPVRQSAPRRPGPWEVPTEEDGERARPWLERDAPPRGTPPPRHSRPPRHTPPPRRRATRAESLRRPRGRPLVALLGATVLVGLFLAFALIRGGGPHSVADGYCSALVGRGYATAYTLLAPSVRAHETAAQFALGAQVQDTLDGPATSCAAGGLSGFLGDLRSVFAMPSSVELPLTITRTRLGTRAGAITVVREGGGWGVVAITGAAQGTPVGPVIVADHFCRALAAGDYAAAFADLSAHQKAVEKSAANFAAEAKQPGATTYAGCTADYHHYAVAGTTATLPLTLDIKVSTPGAAPVVPVADIATFVEQGGTWKLDGLAPAPPAK